MIVQKFNNLAAPFADSFLREQIVSMVGSIEKYKVSDLMALLEKVNVTESKENLKLSNI
jgi:hypothetical protein